MQSDTSSTCSVRPERWNPSAGPTRCLSDDRPCFLDLATGGINTPLDRKDGCQRRDPLGTAAGAEGRIGVGAPPQVWLDGWVDLLDPSTGHTIARLQHDDHLRGFANGSRYIVAYRETEAGVPYMSLLNPRLVR